MRCVGMRVEMRHGLRNSPASTDAYRVTRERIPSLRPSSCQDAQVRRVQLARMRLLRFQDAPPGGGSGCVWDAPKLRAAETVGDRILLYGPDGLRGPYSIPGTLADPDPHNLPIFTTG